MPQQNTLNSRQNLTLSQQGAGTNFTREQQAEAILLLAATLWKRGQKKLAKQRLLELTKTYPNSKAAAVARRQLQE